MYYPVALIILSLGYMGYASRVGVPTGVDVSSLLSKVGINVNGTSEKVGTAAIAYAAHKALSPVRFPPTVALTPVVARFLGKGQDSSDASDGPAP